MNTFLNPIVVIAGLILCSVFVLIGAAMFGLDHGLLFSMSRVEFARGLITYLFAVATIGTAVVLVVSALTGAADELHDRRFQRGKEILSLLLGVFGTIVGFYFGSEVSARAVPEQAAVRLLPLHLGASAVVSGETVVVTTYLSGGSAPYVLAAAFGETRPEPAEPAEAGWIVRELVAPTLAAEARLPVTVVVRDAAGRTAEATARLLVTPPR